MKWYKLILEMKFIKTLIVIVALLVLSPIVSGQNKSIDSLKNLADKSAGIKKVDLLLKIGEEFKNSNFKEHRKYSALALEEARKINYISGIAHALNEFGYALNELNEYEKSAESLTEAKKIFTTLADEHGLMSSFHYIGKNHDYRGNADSAIFYYRKALALANNQHNLINVAQLEMNIGILFWTRGQFKVSLGYFQRALKIREQHGDFESVGNSKNSIGSVYYRLGNFPMAMKYFHGSLEMRLKKNDSLGMIISYNNIGSVYQKLELLDIAQKYYETAIRLADNTDYRFGKALTLYNFGLLYLDKKNFAKSLGYLDKSYAIAKMILSQNLRTMILHYKGLNFEKMNDFSKAEMYYNWALSIAKQAKDRYVESLLLQALARINLETTKIIEAQKLLDKAHKFAAESSVNELLKDDFFLYYKIYSNRNEKLKALENFKLYSEMKDSLLFQSGNNLANILLKFELEQSDREKELLQREKSIIIKEKNQQTLLKNIFIFVSVLILISMVLLYILYSHRVKSQNIIEKQKAELEILNQQLSELNKQKDKLFTVIAHDLKSPFQALLGHADLLKNDIGKLTKDQIQQCGENIHQSGKKIFDLIITLLDWAKQQLGRYQFKPEVFNFSELIDEVYVLYSNLFESKKISFVKNFGENLAVFADKQMINSVLRNLFSNSIKFTKENGSIVIDLYEKSESIEFCISDNGIGMDKELAVKIFTVDFVESKLGTKNEIGTGLGMNLSKEFIEKNKGKIWLETKLGEGSKFYFTLPKSNER